MELDCNEKKLASLETVSPEIQQKLYTNSNLCQKKNIPVFHILSVCCQECHKCELNKY